MNIPDDSEAVALLRRVLEWNEHMGCFDNPVFEDIKNYLNPPDPMKTRNYRPEIRAVLSALVAEGFVITNAHDGGDLSRPSSVDICVEVIAAVDEATVDLSHPDAPGQRFSIFFVLGNDPGEIVCDYTYSDTLVGDLLDETIAKVADEWEGKPQPMEERN